MTAVIDFSCSARSLKQTHLVVTNASKLRVLPIEAEKFIQHIKIRDNDMRGSGLDAPPPALWYR